MSAQGVVIGTTSVRLQAVLSIWREVLGAAAGELDADSNFFLCGGDSLDLARVLVRVRERLGVSLDTQDVRSFSTPARMARCCVRGSDVQPAVSAERFAAASDSGFVCSHGQHALWLAEHMGGACGMYNTAVAIHFTGALRVQTLSRALSLLLRRHEVLRCSLRYEARSRDLIAYVAAPCDLRLEAELVAAGDVTQRLLDAAAQPFDLEHGPLWRVHLVRAGSRHWVLLLCLHHAVTDGWSGSVLLHNLAEGYRALLREPAWEPLQVDAEFRRWCGQQHFGSGADTSWWRRYLAGADRLQSWPSTGAARWPFTMAFEQGALPGSMRDEIRSVSRVQGLRPAALFLTALRFAVLELGGVAELCIGMPANVRNTSAQEAAIGYFVNLLVLRERVDAAAGLIDTARCVQRALDAALRCMVPFTKLARTLRPAPLPSGNIWCDVLFAFQNLPRTQLDFSGVDVRVEALTLPRGQHPLKVEVLWGEGEGLCRIEYATECLAGHDARALLGALQRQLATLLAVAARSS